MLSARDVKVLDINSSFFGVPEEELMENAGRSVANIIKERYKPKSVVIFCGLGNNGGDGLVAARYLSRFCKVYVVLIDDPSKIKTSLSRNNFERLRGIDTVDILVYTNDGEKIDNIMDKCDVIVDALLGIGLSGKLREPFRSCVTYINEYSKNKYTVSVDVPTGLGTDISINPDLTITFHDLKEGMNENRCGEIDVVDIGIPRDAEVYVGPGELKVFYPKPSSSSHKGDNGVVLVVGGGPYTGAPVLSALASLRTGVDLSYLAVPKRVSGFLHELFTRRGRYSLLLLNLIIKELSDYDRLTTKDVSSLEELIKKSDTILIGPGLGRDKETIDSTIEIVKICKNEKKSCVIDADALFAVGKQIDILKGMKCVVTPHRGEFFHITKVRLPDNIEDSEGIVKEWAKKLGITIVLKGKEDIITDGNRLKRNKTHHPSMTVGGTGDVLAGIIAALLAKGVDPFLAGCIGTFINGSAGLSAFEKFSYGVLATDIVEEIPSVLKKYL